MLEISCCGRHSLQLCHSCLFGMVDEELFQMQQAHLPHCISRIVLLHVFQWRREPANYFFCEKCNVVDSSNKNQFTDSRFHWAMWSITILPLKCDEEDELIVSWRVLHLFQKARMRKLEWVSQPQQLVSKNFPFFSRKNPNFWPQCYFYWVSGFALFCRILIDRLRCSRKLESFSWTFPLEISKAKLHWWSLHRFIFESWEVNFSWQSILIPTKNSKTQNLSTKFCLTFWASFFQLTQL